MTMLGANVVDDWNKYFKSQAKLDFSRDAAPVIGFERNDIAKRRAFTWFRAYEMTITQAGMAAVIAFGVKDEIVEALLSDPAVVVRGRAAVQSLREGGLQAAAEADRRAIGLFALRSKMR
jgi:hypothetical protein